MKQISSERLEYKKIRYNKYEQKSYVVNTVTGWAFVSPVFLASLVFILGAIVYGLILTFYSGKLSNLQFVGLSNWDKIFNSTTLDLGTAFKNTLLYCLTAVPIALFVTILLASLIRSKYVKSKRLFLGIFFLPSITSAIAATIIFTKIISPDGIIKIDYYSDPSKLMWIVIISGIWGSVSGQLIGMNAAFSTIDTTQYEAAEMDGIGNVKKFTRVTIPSMGPILSYALFIGISGGLAIFTGPYILAGALKLDPEGLKTIAFVGYNFIVPIAGTTQNIGLGTTILFMVAVLMLATSFVTNLIFPISKTTY